MTSVSHYTETDMTTETERGDLDFCLSQSDYIDTQRQRGETLTSVSAGHIT